MLNRHAMIDKVEQTAQLITLPEIYFRLKELLAEPDYTMAEVALLVGRDPALAMRFLRVVNSPLNRRSRTIETISHAVSLLGSRQVHDIALCATVAESFEGIRTDLVNLKLFWQRSVSCAVLAQRLAAASGDMASDRLFVIGLLHDIGHMLMFLAIPEESQQAILQAKEMQKPLFQVERELLGFDYAQIGGNLMGKWGFPKRLQIATRYHPEPHLAKQFSQETSLLHLSHLLVQADLEEGRFGAIPFVAEDSSWMTTGLTEERCVEIKQTSLTECAEVANSLFP